MLRQYRTTLTFISIVRFYSVMRLLGLFLMMTSVLQVACNAGVFW